MKSLSVLSLLAFLAAAPVPSDTPPCDGNHTLRLDAVELVAGREVAGQDDLWVVHHRFQYHFANQANRDEFRAHPERYEIQMGGACGSMGPLSGDGSTSIWAVHDGRIYVFASQACRKRFLSAPQDMLDREEAPPATTPASLSRGRELLALAVAAIGGAERLDSVDTYSERLSFDTKSGDQTYHVTRTLTLHLPGGVRTHDCWNDSCWSDTAIGDAGWRESKSGPAPTHAQQRLALTRAHGRHPLALLQARNESGFVALGNGERETIAVPDEADVEVEWLIIAHRGANTRLGIEPQTGRVRAIRFVGRGLGSFIGDTQKIFAQFTPIDGLTLPSRVHTTFNGKPQPNYSGTFDLQELNRPEHLALFKDPLSP